MKVLKSVHRLIFAGDKVIEPATVFEADDDAQEAFFLKNGSAVEADAGEVAIYEQQKQPKSQPSSRKMAPSVAAPVVAATAATGDEKQ